MFLTIKLYLCKTKLFETEVFSYIKVDLALNNQKMLICHKTQTNKRTSSCCLFTFVDILFPLKVFVRYLPIRKHKR